MTTNERDCLKEVESFDRTGFNYTMSLFTGKYKLTVLYAIYRHDVIRFNALQKYLNLLSHKTLSNTLKELEQDDLIIKKIIKRYRQKLNIVCPQKENLLFRFCMPCAIGARSTLLKVKIIKVTIRVL